jgi:hypothetical protein
VLAFAGFGDPPASLWGAPAYAARVILRRRALRADLDRARRRRSPDVGLYEASLRAADDAAVRSGVAFAVVMLVVALVAIAVAARLVLHSNASLELPW